MTTQKQIEANRNNAKLSTGPKTAEGKAQIKYNALKHGFRSATLVLMPNEDPAEYAARVDAWLVDNNPTTSTEENLIRHAADLSWLIDRAKWQEGMFLHQQMSDAMAQAERVHLDQHRALLHALLPTAEEIPSCRRDFASVRELRTQVEATADACNHLLSVWQNLRASALTQRPWDDIQELHAVRLLGFGDSIIYDTALLDLVVANRFARDPKIDKYSWSNGPRELSLGWTATHEALERKPANVAEAFALMVKTADQEIARLVDLLADRERDGDLDVIVAGEHVVDLPLFDANMDVEKIRKYRESLSRELLRTLDALGKLRRDQARHRKELGNRANKAKSEVIEPENQTIRNEPLSDFAPNKAIFTPEIGANEAIFTRRQKRQMRKQEQEQARRAKQSQFGK